MPTTKKRINISVDRDTEWALKKLAKMYGVPVATKATDIITTQVVSCKSCKETLSQQLLEEEPGVSASWEIARCKNCGELTVFDTPENIKRTKLKNCTWERSYLKEKVDEDELEKKLEELKKWFE